MKYYAGIGSRMTPKTVCLEMTKIATVLSQKGYILNSGGAAGADSAFEKGAGDNKQIFLPYDGMNGRKVDGKQFFLYSEESYQIASKFYRGLANAPPMTQKMMCRNVHQVLGLDLKTPVDFLVCWTPGGGVEGGTGMAMRVAKGHKIPIYNLKMDSDRKNLFSLMKGMVGD